MDGPAGPFYRGPGRHGAPRRLAGSPANVREDATLALDRSGENSIRNLVTLRLEGRFGFVVKRPKAFVEVALA